MSSPTARTLKALRDAGWTCEVVERFNPHAGARIPDGKGGTRPAGVRHDLFGFADIFAFRKGESVRRDDGRVIVIRDGGVLMVQATSVTNVAARLTKIRMLPTAAAWLAAGGRIQVYGWERRGKKWGAKIIEVKAGDMDEVVLLNLPKKRRRDRFQPVELF